jgi:hypothetical protein
MYAGQTKRKTELYFFQAIIVKNTAEPDPPSGIYFVVEM